MILLETDAPSFLMHAFLEASISNSEIEEGCGNVELYRGTPQHDGPPCWELGLSLKKKILIYFTKKMEKVSSRFLVGTSS